MTVHHIEFAAIKMQLGHTVPLWLALPPHGKKVTGSRPTLSGVCMFSNTCGFSPVSLHSQKMFMFGLNEFETLNCPEV